MKEKLEIIIITYNRANYLKKTLEELTSSKSPVKNCRIRILNNASTDNTIEICEKFKRNFNNVSYITNKYNVGGNANIAKAIELADKEYFWILGDDDLYDWTNWKEAEKYIKGGYDCIVIANVFVNPTLIDRVKQCVFLSGCIYKTSIINNDVIRNVYDAVSDYCPHAPLFCEVLNNNNKSFCYIKGAPIIIYGGWAEGVDISSYSRGNNEQNLYPIKSFFAGIFRCISLLKDDNLRITMMKSWLCEDQNKNYGIKQKETNPIKNIICPEIKNGIKNGQGFLLQNIANYFIYFDIKMKIRIIKTLMECFLIYYLPRKFYGLFKRNKQFNFWRIK